MNIDYKINIWEIIIILMLIFLFVYVKFFIPERLNIEITHDPFISCVSEHNYKIDKLCWYKGDDRRMQYVNFENNISYEYNESMI